MFLTAVTKSINEFSEKEKWKPVFLCPCIQRLQGLNPHIPFSLAGGGGVFIIPPVFFFESPPVFFFHNNFTHYVKTRSPLDRSAINDVGVCCHISPVSTANKGSRERRHRFYVKMNCLITKPRMSSRVTMLISRRGVTSYLFGRVWAQFTSYVFGRVWPSPPPRIWLSPNNGMKRVQVWRERRLIRILTPWAMSIFNLLSPLP